jgi:hypothetical protein
MEYNTNSKQHSRGTTYLRLPMVMEMDFFLSLKVLAVGMECCTIPTEERERGGS